MVIELRLDELEQDFLLTVLRNINITKATTPKAIGIIDKINIARGNEEKIDIVASFGPHLLGGAPFMFRAIAWSEASSTPAVEWAKRKYEKDTSSGTITLSAFVNDVVRWGWQRPGDHRGSFMQWGIIRPGSLVQRISQDRAKEAFRSPEQVSVSGQILNPAELFAAMPISSQKESRTTWPTHPAPENPSVPALDESGSEKSQTSYPTGHCTAHPTADDSATPATSPTSSTDP